MSDKESSEDKPVAEPAPPVGLCGKSEPCSGSNSCGGKSSCSEHVDPDADPAAYLDDDYDEVLSRSDFMRKAFGGTVLLWGGVALAPIVAYLTPPPGEDKEAAKVTSVEVCKVSELPKGTGKNFRFGSFPAVVINDMEGQLHAFNAICTHLGCTVQFRADKQCIYCACHGGEYDASTGKNIAGPPPKPLPVLKVAIVDDKIVVSKA
ncbi:Rieske (2Fe-2S) protein [Candidatus Obscuribacterales bacterium]|nr:Rieske (2Fe-2S) protein [Candidatus Obscuribacterales bacterium]